MSRIPGWLSAGALMMTMVLGVGYLVIGVLAVIRSGSTRASRSISPTPPV
ncbi:hypothetical protein [Gordonia jinghuaiqii]|nr:hypothetical protein [Gordonia jinghuaiqii]